MHIPPVAASGRRKMGVKSGLDIEEALNAAGGWGRYQKIMLLLSLLSAIPNSYVAIHFVFSHYEPDHHCTYPPAYYQTNNSNVTGDQGIISTIIPFEVKQRNKVVSSQCKMYKRNYSRYPMEIWPDYFNENGSEVTDCIHGITYDFPETQETATTEFSMVCEDDWKNPVATSMYHAGVAIGSVLTIVADWYGRKPVFIGACCVQILSQVLSVVAWSYPVYCFSILLSGLFGITNYVVFFVLVTEITDCKWRNFITIASAFGFSLGYCSLSLIGYLFRSWRVYVGVLAFIGALIYLPCCWYFPESCRWLAQKGRSDESVKYLRVIARVNKRTATLNHELQEKGGYVIPKNNITSTGMMESMRVLFRTRIRAAFLTSVLGWTVSSSLYFSIALYSTEFSKDRYINIFLGGLVELPSCILGFILMKFLGRPRTAAVLMVLGGISSIALPMVPQHLSGISTILAMVGKASSYAVFCAWYLISSEVVPTLQRSASLSLCASASRVGSLGVPYFMFLRKYNYWAPNMAMGVAAIVSGIFGIMLVPETRGVNIPDTIKEATENRRLYRIDIFKKFPPQNTTQDEDARQYDHEHIPMI